MPRTVRTEEKADVTTDYTDGGLAAYEKNSKPHPVAFGISVDHRELSGCYPVLLGSLWIKVAGMRRS